MTQQNPAQPETPKKRRKGCLLGIFGAAVIVSIIVAASSQGSKGTEDRHSDAKPGSHQSAPKAPETSPLEAFQAYAAKHGTAQEKAAAKHVTKIQGADGKNDILDSADVYTNYTGDLVSGDAGNGKLIASVFADWQKSRGKDSENGLVTVYNKGGDILNTGQY